MTTWRMAMKQGSGGPNLFGDCRKLGVAAIYYSSFRDVDLSKVPQGQPRRLWSRLPPSQHASLRRLAFEMKVGDVIYVKDGPKIVCKGVITKPYFFDHRDRVRDTEGDPWRHQVGVQWDEPFEVVGVSLTNPRATVQPLNADEVRRLESALSRTKPNRKSGRTPTYLLTWNPTNPDTWKSFERDTKVSKRGKSVQGSWSSGSNKSIPIGARLFMLRQYKDRGIIAAGFATSEVFEDKHWELPDETARYVNCRFEHVLAIDERLPYEALAQEVPGHDWTFIGASGQQVYGDSANMLEEAWQRHITALGRSSRRKSPVLFPDQVSGSRFIEGASTQVTVNSYERSPQARKACIQHWGKNCSVCGFNFGSMFGSLGEDFIHVHHLLELASIGREYEVDPIKDMRPVCPNCHAMLHIGGSPTLSIRALKEIVRKAIDCK